MNKNNLQFKNKGFTLIEIMVATSIFTIIMLIAIGSLVVASDSAKKSQALQTAMDNVNFAMDSMTRSLRTGTTYSCITTPTIEYIDKKDCVNTGNSNDGGSGIAFTPVNHPNADTAYAQVQRDDLTYTLQRCDLSNPFNPSCVDLVANNVNIKTLRFFVNGSDPSDKIQPSVYIIMEGTITIKDQPTSFAIQTMTSQRTLDQ